MNSEGTSFQIRPFEPRDAEYCFRLRTEAFIKLFYDEIGPEAVSTGVNAYMPADFVRMAERMSWIVAEDSGQPVGFCALRMLDAHTAELLFLYVQLDRVGQGIGKRLLCFFEEWLRERHPEVSGIVLDTIVPDYNQAIYEKMGFSAIGEGRCEYPGGYVRSIRLRKQLAH